MGCAEPEFVDSAACGYRALWEQYLTLLTRGDETNSGVSNEFRCEPRATQERCHAARATLDPVRSIQARPLPVWLLAAGGGGSGAIVEIQRKELQDHPEYSNIQSAASEPIRTSRATSRNRQKAFASFICRGLWQSGSKRRGLPTTIHAHCARDVATLKRFGL